MKSMLFLVTLVASTAAVIVLDSNSISNDQEDEVIIGVSTLVNGVKPQEIPEILDQLSKLRLSVKGQAFEALSRAVKSRRRSLEETRKLVDAMKRVLIESLTGLSAVRQKVETIQERLENSHPELRHFTPDEAFFLTNVRDSVPDIVRFTREQFRAVAHLL